MRGTLRLLASVNKPARYLAAGAPTGLAGLRADPSPRNSLLFLYHRTLDRLAEAVPETSLYRQSVEAVTKQRLGLVAAAKPDGYDEWAARARAVILAHPEAFDGTAEAAAEAAAAEEQPGGGANRSSNHRPADIPGKGWDYLEGLSLKGRPYFLRQEFPLQGDPRVEDAYDFERWESPGGNYLPEDAAVQQQLASAKKDLKDMEQAKTALEARLKDAPEDEKTKIEERLKSVAEAIQKQTYGLKLAELDLSFLLEEPILTASQYVWAFTLLFLWVSLRQQLTYASSRVEELENKIGAGLIEEVIQVAVGELQLVDTMQESKPYVCTLCPIPSLWHDRHSNTHTQQMGESRREATTRPMGIF